MISDLHRQHQLPGKTMMPETMNNVDCLENQLCRVCDEKAAGFHFGAFTCEGCKSFFGRFCNNQTVIPECKNNYVCVIDKRNRTSCKACRLKKCLSVGMSKSGCRYGRRSNWFKIHCLMQKNQQQKTSSAQILPSPNLPSPPAYPMSLPQPTPYSRPLKISSSRSPSPLNISTESATSPTSSSTASTSPPNPPPTSFHPFQPRPLQLPLFDPLSLYRLSPLLALSPLLQQHSLNQQQQSPLLTQFSDFKQQLDLLAERRLLFERLQKEASSACSTSPTPSSASTPSDSSYPSSSSPGPVDLSVK